ncbi:MAG: DUF4860 domain-containing protein [Eggerthellaceae bacterium]|nr:DUF4860 domain-containing protein [Eggerthellaceae bacterium]
MNINYAMVSAFERSKKPEVHRAPSQLFMLVLMAVFFIALMGGLAAGAGIYSAVVQTHSYTDDVHLQSGLLANTVHVNDSVYAVERGEGPEGPALVLVESLEYGTFETRVYQYKGTIFTEYAISGRDYNPTSATPLFRSDAFEFAFDGELLTMTTDKGTLEVALRSTQGGAV